MRRYNIYVNDPEIVEYLAAQDNISEYIRNLVEADMGGGGSAAPPSQDVLAEILAELKLMRRDMANLKVVAEKPQEPTKKGSPAGLARQANRFREGKRDV